METVAGGELVPSGREVVNPVKPVVRECCSGVETYVAYSLEITAPDSYAHGATGSHIRYVMLRGRFLSARLACQKTLLHALRGALVCYL